MLDRRVVCITVLGAFAGLALTPLVGWSEETVRLHAAGSLRGALTEVAEAFSRAYSITVKAECGASGLLRERLEREEAGDVTGRRASAGVTLSLGLMVTAAMAGAVWAQREPPDLKALPPGQHVASVRSCRGVYEVALKDGSVRSFKEFDLGFKTDTSAKGPDAAAPALLPTGRAGDRAFVVFAGLDELKAWIKKC